MTANDVSVYTIVLLLIWILSRLLSAQKAAVLRPFMLLCASYLIFVHCFYLPFLLLLSGVLLGIPSVVQHHNRWCIQRVNNVINGGFLTSTTHTANNLL